VVAGLLLSIDESAGCFGRTFAVILVGCEHQFPLFVINRDVVME